MKCRVISLTLNSSWINQTLESKGIKMPLIKDKLMKINIDMDLESNSLIMEESMKDPG
jgi:hypothetical protein